MQMGYSDFLPAISKIFFEEHRRIFPVHLNPSISLIFERVSLMTSKKQGQQSFYDLGLPAIGG
jgi:hypothetical protein